MRWHVFNSWQFAGAWQTSRSSWLNAVRLWRRLPWMRRTWRSSWTRTSDWWSFQRLPMYVVAVNRIEFLCWQHRFLKALRKHFFSPDRIFYALILIAVPCKDNRKRFVTLQNRAKSLHWVQIKMCHCLSHVFPFPQARKGWISSTIMIIQVRFFPITLSARLGSSHTDL